MFEEVTVEAKVDSGRPICATWYDAIYDLELEHLSFRLNYHLLSFWALLIANRTVLATLKVILSWESPFEVLHR